MQIPAHLLPTKFTRSEVLRTHRTLIAKKGTTPEMVLDPDFWVHGSLQVEGRGGGSVLKVHDEIDVIADDGSFDLKLRVIEVDARGFWVRMRLLHFSTPELEQALLSVITRKPEKTLLDEEAVRAEKRRRYQPDPDGYIVEWAGGVGANPHRWRILDRVGSIVAKGFATEAEANVELGRIKGEKAAA